MFREALLIRALAELADDLVEEFDIVDLLTTLSDRCVDILDVDTAGVMLSGPGSNLQVVASSSAAMRVLELFELQASQGPCVDCYNTGEAIINEELSADDDGRWPSFTRHALDAGFHSVHSLPMRFRGRTLGALNMFRTDTGLLRESDVVAAQALADVASIAIVQHHITLDTDGLDAELADAIDSRTVIEQAKGIVGEVTGLGSDQAFSELRRYASAHGLRLADVSRRIVAGTVDPNALEPRHLADSKRPGGGVSTDRPTSAAVTVCLVEDNKHLREEIHDFLADAGIAVVAAVGTVKDGEVAITTNRPDVAVIDYYLPDGTGVDLIRTLARTAPHVTLLVYSASITGETKREALGAGAAAVIQKTMEPDDLLDAILKHSVRLRSLTTEPTTEFAD